MHIKKVAEKLFAKKGYKKVSVDEIVLKADIAKGTFYLYFPTKEDLYLEICYGYKRGAQKEIACKYFSEEKDPKERIFMKLYRSVKKLAKIKIIREIYLENKDYFSPSINSELIFNLNTEFIKLALGEDGEERLKDGITPEMLSLINMIFVHLLHHKKDFPSEQEFYKFIKQFARIIADGSFKK